MNFENASFLTRDNELSCKASLWVSVFILSSLKYTLSYLLSVPLFSMVLTNSEQLSVLQRMFSPWYVIVINMFAHSGDNNHVILFWENEIIFNLTKCSNSSFISPSLAAYVRFRHLFYLWHILWIDYWHSVVKLHIKK